MIGRPVAEPRTGRPGFGIRLDIGGMCYYFHSAIVFIAYPKGRAMSATPRLAPLEPPFDDTAAVALAGTMPGDATPIALFRTLARNPRIMTKLKGGSMLGRGLLPLREREILIDRTTARCGAEYEWGVHIAFFAEKAGFSPAHVADTCAGSPDPGLWTPRELALFEAADALWRAPTLDDTHWERLRAHLSPEEIIEVVAVCGTYQLISAYINVLRIANEPGMPAFPEAGIARRAA
jgi:alkylhydroperoxidase family enzyme